MLRRDQGEGPGEDWREAVLQGLSYTLTGLSVVVGPIVVIQTHTVGPRGLGMAAFVMVCMLAATFARRLGFRVRALLFLLSMYLFATTGLVRVGYVVGPTCVFVLVVVNAGLLVGRRAMWVALAITAATMIGAGYLAVSTSGTYMSPAAMDVLLPVNWARMTLMFVVSAGLISLTVTYVVARIESALSERTRSFDQLRDEQAQRAHAQAQLELAQNQLQQTQKLEAIGTLAGGVAHDFNNSLMVVQGWLDLLQRARATDRSKLLEDALPEIQRAVDHATSTTRQLLTFGRRSVQAPRALSLAEELATFEKTIRRLLPSDIEIRAAVAGDVPLVRTDAAQLQQALFNLAINARDAMPSGGVLQIEAARTHALPDACGDARAADACWAAITLRDSGSGMDAATAERAFEPFFTTKSEGKGTGLGLATVYGVMKQSGGHVVMQSVPGRGTSVTLYLPEAASELSAGVRALSPARATQPATIVVAEDDEGVRRVLVAALQDDGHRVLAAPDSDAAIALVDAQVGRIDLLCTDGVMPGVGTRRLIERFRERNPDAAVLLCSGHLDEELLARGVKAGELAFLQKPFTQADLLGAVSQLLAHRAVC